MRIPLRLQPVLIALTLLNLGILGVAIAREQAVAAPSLTSDGILRGRGLQIVDDEARYEPASQSIRWRAARWLNTLKRCCSG